MKRGNPRRKKASLGKEELSQIETSSLKGISEDKSRKVQKTQTLGLRRSTRLSTTQQITPKLQNTSTWRKMSRLKKSQ